MKKLISLVIVLLIMLMSAMSVSATSTELSNIVPESVECDEAYVKNNKPISLNIAYGDLRLGEEKLLYTAANGKQLYVRLIEAELGKLTRAAGLHNEHFGYVVYWKVLGIDQPGVIFEFDLQWMDTGNSPLNYNSAYITKFTPSFTVANPFVYSVARGTLSVTGRDAFQNYTVIENGIAYTVQLGVTIDGEPQAMPRFIRI